MIAGLDDYALLILDDLGVERNTEFVLEQMFQIIDGRYRCCKPLIVTTNLRLEETSILSIWLMPAFMDEFWNAALPSCLMEGISGMKERNRPRRTPEKSFSGQRIKSKEIFYEQNHRERFHPS